MTDRQPSPQRQASCCPHCGQPLPSHCDDEAAMIEKIRAACATLGITILWNDTVSEVDAAQLLGRSPFTLRNWRAAGAPLPYTRSGNRVRYCLSDIATFMMTKNNYDDHN